jgi:hypothetical protein
VPASKPIGTARFLSQDKCGVLLDHISMLVKEWLGMDGEQANHFSNSRFGAAGSMSNADL